MTRPIAIRLFFFLCTTSFIFTSCSSSDDGDPAPEGQTTTLEDLKALFDSGDITHIDFETVEQRVLLDETIVSMEIKSSTSIFDFKLLEIITSPPNNALEKHKTSLTFSSEAEPIMVDDKPFGNWVETVISINGKNLDDFTPRANLIDSEITTNGLVILEDKLRIKFKKK